MTETVACDKCGGTGRIELLKRECGAVILLGLEEVTCYATRQHPGEPHRAILCAPCYACGGYDEHVLWCGVYDMVPWADPPSHWYEWRDGDLAVALVCDASDAAEWRRQYQPREQLYA